MKKALTFLLIGCCALLIKPFAQPGTKEQQAQTFYKEALKLFNHPEPTERTDSLAVSKFLSAANAASSAKATARLLVDCYEKVAVIKQTYGLQREAVVFYKKAIASCLKHKLPDSLLFKPYLYSGTAHYFLHSFDSSTYYLKKAESLFQKYPTLQEAQRLYNSFGAIYYEAGNYRQSINYFSKALQLNQRTKELDKEYVYNFKSNIASALRRLEQYDSAAVMYKSLIPLGIARDELLINLGATYLENNKADSALHYLLKANATDKENAIGLRNALGAAYLRKNRTADAFVQLQKALRKKTSSQLRQKDYKTGLTYKLLGDAEQQNHNLTGALRNYQRAIIQLDYAFNDTVVSHNPSDVMVGFRSYILFESLAAKAQCFQKLYEKSHRHNCLNSSLQTYQSAFKLAEYIEKSFDTEDARLFMVQKVFPVYQEAVTLMIRSYEQTHRQEDLEAAFRWAEKSKAIALYINTKENEIKSYAGIPDSLLKQERELKFNLSRLFLKIDQTNNDDQIQAISAEIRDHELALSRLTDKLNDYPNYHREKFSYDTIDVAQIRRKVLDQRTAVVSYFQTKTDVYCFVLTQTSIYYRAIRKDLFYEQSLRAIKASLQTIVPGAEYQGSTHARLLYHRLIEPIEGSLPAISSLIIIPYDELRLLPFEALEDRNNNFLLEKYAVTYQYAASFLQTNSDSRVDLNKILAVAPFGAVEKNSHSIYERLPASTDEIRNIPGEKLFNQAATKINFTERAADASIIHLATHAVVNNEKPSRSYIAFYPVGGAHHQLYAHELQNAPFANVQLVFLSACETAGGQIINGEGVMSLSRALSYAGCSNIITSMWKAEDNATAQISVKFYAYLQQGYNFAEALRRAKLSLLHDGRYVQFHSPQYWSHLVFIGNPQQLSSGTNLWVLAWAIVITGTVAFWWIRYKK